MANAYRTERSDRAFQDSPIRVRGLTVRVGGAQNVLNSVNLSVRRGEILAIVGSSGGGKTVLVRTLLGLQHPEAGEIWLFDRPLISVDDEERRALLRRCGILFQDGALFSSLTVQENIEVPLREIGHLPDSLSDAIALLKISLVGLPPDVADLYPSELSGGMRKRAARSRAIALDPELLFLDEPTAGLDPSTATEADQLLLELSTTLGLTVVMNTHDLDSVCAVADRVAVLVEGHIIAVAPVDEVERLNHPWIRAYFHGPRGRASARSAKRRENFRIHG